MSREREPIRGWGSSIKANLELWGYMVLPADQLQETLSRSSKKLVIVAMLQAMASCMFISLAIVGLLDGPAILKDLLLARYHVQSITLPAGILIFFLLILGMATTIMFLLPLAFNFLVNRFRSKDYRQSPGKITIASCHGMITPMMFTPIILLLVILANWNVPFYFHVMEDFWENIGLYSLASLLLFSLVGFGISQWKLLGVKGWRALISPFMLFLVLVVAILPFIRF